MSQHDKNSLEALRGDIPDPPAPATVASPPSAATTAPAAASAPEKESGECSVLAPLGSYHVTSKGKYASGYQGLNPGIGAACEIGKNLEAFGVVIAQNSYNDPTAMAGVNYTPLNAQLGDFKLNAGVMAGVAYTAHGSYAEQNPKLSIGNLTAVAGLTASAVHEPTGHGLQFTLVPPIGKRDNGEDRDGYVGVSYRNRF